MSITVKPLKLPPIHPTMAGSENNFQLVPHQPQEITSTSYKLTGDNVKHVLPLQESLQPNQDTKTGEIETWPAYASRSVSDTGVIAKSFSRNMVAIKRNNVPKPKFLSALETYVRKEVASLGCVDPKPNELRLQAYREVFEYLIEDFKTYKPLLSQIKSEYEKMLSHYRQRIHELEPLKAMLITVSEQCDQKIMKIREEERQEIMELKKVKMDLLKHIDSMKEQDTSLKAQVAKLQEQLAVEYKKYRDECDMRKLLISDMNDLRHQQEDLKRAAGQGAIDADDDPIRLKLALKVAREDLTRQADQLTRMQADYGDVIPRRDFQMLEAKYLALEEKQGLLQSDFTQLKEEHDTMLEVHKQVLEQRDQYYTQAESLRRSATPRPRWSKCGEFVEGGPDSWHDQTSGKTSEQILDAFLEEVKARGPQGPEEFEGKGLGEDVPKYLRHEGTARNRKMKKSEVTSLLKEIWLRKVISDAERGSREPMTDFLHTFFMEKFSNYEEMAAEWAYSLHDALHHYEKEAHINMFLEIINGVATEDLYYRQMDIIKKLMVELGKLDVGKTERVSQPQFITALKTAFSLKTEASVDALVAAALEELEGQGEGGEGIEYQALFTEDEEGHNGPFLNLLRAQEDEECTMYLNDISNQLEGMDEVPPAELRNTFMIIDPAIDMQLMMNYLKIAYKCETETVNDAEPVDKSVLLERLRKGGAYRVGAVY